MNVVQAVWRHKGSPVKAARLAPASSRTQGSWMATDLRMSIMKQNCLMEHEDPEVRKTLGFGQHPFFRTKGTCGDRSPK